MLTDLTHLNAHVKANPLHCMNTFSTSDANGRVWTARMMTASGVPVARGQGPTPSAALAALNAALRK